MRSINLLRGSSVRPKSTFRSPTFNHSKFKRSETIVSAPVAAKIPRLRMNPITIAQIEISPLNRLCSRVNSVITTAATSGRNRMTQAELMRVSFIRELQLHRRQVFHVHALSLPIKRHNQSQPDRHFRSGD